MKVGFIGLGTMGAHMASNLQTYLLKSNHGMVVYDVNRASADPHIARGATWADSPKALAEQCDVIFASLPGPPEVEAVATGPNGLIHGMKKGAAFFDLATNSPTVVRKIHDLAEEYEAVTTLPPESAVLRWGPHADGMELWFEEKTDENTGGSTVPPADG